MSTDPVQNAGWSTVGRGRKKAQEAQSTPIRALRVIRCASFRCPRTRKTEGRVPAESADARKDSQRILTQGEKCAFVISVKGDKSGDLRS